MSKLPIHLLVKYNEYDSQKLDVMENHIKVNSEEGHVLWGVRGKESSLFNNSKIMEWNNQISSGIPTYIFFLQTETKLTRKMYVGRMNKIYNKQNFHKFFNQVHLFPEYYSAKQNFIEDLGLVVDVSEIHEVSPKKPNTIESFLDEIIEYSGKPIKEVKNQRSAFRVHIIDGFKEFIHQLYENRDLDTNNSIKSSLSDNLKNKKHMIGVGHEKQNYSNTRYKRNSKLSEECIEVANFKCEINSDHLTFISRKKNKQFMESHHLVPMYMQDEFHSCKLDVLSNMISLCPNCHAQLHNGVQSSYRESLRKLYNSRIDRLNNDGIYVTFDELLQYYTIKNQRDQESISV